LRGGAVVVILRVARGSRGLGQPCHVISTTESVILHGFELL
jgi:hypothetical protein